MPIPILPEPKCDLCEGPHYYEPGGDLANCVRSLRAGLTVMRERLTLQRNHIRRLQEALNARKTDAT